MQRFGLHMAAQSLVLACCGLALPTQALAQGPSQAQASQPKPAVRSAAIETSGAAYVTSLPSGADLWVDGTHLGRTPMLVSALFRGRHTMTLAKSGWATQDIAFRIVPNSVALQNHYLVRIKGDSAPREGNVLFHAPSGATVSVDAIGMNDLKNAHALLAGHHVVRVQQGKKSFSRDFDVIPDMTTDLLLRDIPAARMPSVVAQVSAFIPSGSITIQHTKIVLRYRGHIAVGHLGDTTMRVDTQMISVDPAPILLDGKLYLPVDIITMLTGAAP